MIRQKKCVKLSLADETAVVPSFMSESYGVPITFSSPRSHEALLDLMVATIQAKDLRKCSTLVICQQSAEARHVKSEMGKRNINTMLLDADNLTTHNLVRLWSQGYIQQVLIACDDHLNLLEEVSVDFVIHTALPPIKKFKERLKMLSKSESKAEMLAFISDGRENGSVKDVHEDPEVEGCVTPLEIPSYKLPILELKDRLNMLSKSADDQKEKIRGFEDSESEGWETPPIIPRTMLPIWKLKFTSEGPKENNRGFEDSESEGWETPPIIPRTMLPIWRLKFDGPNHDGLQSQAEMGNAFDKEKNGKTPLNDKPEKASEKVWSCRALTRVNGSVPIKKSLSEEPEFEGWVTPPDTPTFMLPEEEFNDDYNTQSKTPSVSDGAEEEEKEEPEVINLEEMLHQFGPFHSVRSRSSSKYSKEPTTGRSSTAASVIISVGKGVTRAQFGVLVWCRDPIVSCYDISGVPDLNPSIRNTMMALMDMKNRQARGLQRYAWPHVSSGKSLVAVGPEKTGKTWCFLPGLCQRTHEHMLVRSFDLYGPISIVVCVNQQQGKQISQWITQLMDPLNTGDRIPYEPVVTLWEKGTVKEVAESLRHSVGILVTTPDMLLLLKECNTEKTPIFSFNSIKCLALDNLSDLMRHLPDITAKMVDWIIKEFDFGADKCQLFVTTRLWPEILMRESVLPLIPDVLVVFKDPLEATIFWKSHLEVNLVEHGEQCRSLVEMLQDRSLNDKRIVVVCQSKEDVLHLKLRLDRQGIRSEAIYADGGLSTVNQWRMGTLAAVLLVTDDMVNKVNCGPIDQLIHYNPAITWMRFKFRFTLLYNNYISSEGGSPGKAVVLLQQTHFDHLWLLSEFVMWHQLPRPEDWLRVLAEIRQERDRPNLELAKLPLCLQLSSYGDCYRRTCRYRHLMWSEEVAPAANYPTEGKFFFHVLSCNSPTQIAVRVNELYPTKVFMLNSPMSQLGFEVHMYYDIEKNRRRHFKPKVEEIVIVMNQKRYERAVINGTSERVVTVRMLDSGIHFLTYKRCEIYVCEERHQFEPGQAMEVRVIGIEPDTLERIWTKDMHDVVRTNFFGRLSEKRSHIFSAIVKFVLGRTIFVETVLDDEGRDLRRFLLDRLHVHEEIKSMEKLVKITIASQPCPKEL